MTEMDKLEEYLKEKGYNYTRGRRFCEETDRFYREVLHTDGGEQINVYSDKGRCLWDAICGDGSYGYKQGLLEIMGSIVNKREDGDSVVGYLTAQDIIERLEAKRS